LSQFPVILLNDAHSDRHDMAYRVTRERVLNVVNNWGVRFLYGACSSEEWFWINSNCKNGN